MKYGTKEASKKYYSISEVAEILELAPHVFRYWEKEFTMLIPLKNRAGNRNYREKDIKLLKKIKRLLYMEKYTIEGARLQLQKTESDKNPKQEKRAAEQRKTQKVVLSELQSIKSLLDKKD